MKAKFLVIISFVSGLLGLLGWLLFRPNVGSVRLPDRLRAG
jgi:hypothetical protein